MFMTVLANFQSRIKNLDVVTFGSSLTVTDGYQTEGGLIFFDEEDFMWPTF